MSHKTGFYEGRLGIGLASDGGDGTGNPRFPLDVNGDIRLTGAILKANGEKYLGGLTKIGFDNMTELQNGNIGVGTETPTVLLDISGNTKIRGDLQLNGILKDSSGNARIFSNWETQQPNGVFVLTVTPYNIGLKSSAGGTVTGQTYSHSSTQGNGFHFEEAFDGGNGGWTASGSTSDKYNDSSPYEYIGSQVTINIGETKNVTVTTARLQNDNQIVDTADLFIYGKGFINYLNIQVGDTVTYEHPTLGSQTTTVSQVFTGGSNDVPYMIALADNHNVTTATAISSCTFHNKKEGLAGSWGQIDIGQNSVISSFSITGNSDYTGRRPSNFYFLGSLDGTNWTTIQHVQNPTYSNHSATWNLSEVQGPFRYYRISVLNLSGYSDSRVSIDEIELFGALESQTYGGNSVDLYRNSSVTIGDTSADITNKLFVNGNTKIGGDLQLNGILKDSSGNARIFSNWDISGHDIYRDISGGNVGIGTSTPQTQLDVSGTITSDAIVSKTNTLDNLNVGVGNPTDYTFSVETKLTASDGGAGDEFGRRVAMDGNYVIIGAPYNDENGSNTGCAYIFDFLTGNEIHKLTASDAAASDYFGDSVAISGNYAIVGANSNDDDGDKSGSAYIFNVTTGTEIHKLTASDAEAYDRFGISVAIDGNYAIVGAQYEDDSNKGAAYIFNVQTGAQLHKLTASDGAGGDEFGQSVAISGNYAVVGAYLDDDNGTYSGNAFVFNVTTGTQLHKLTASDGAAYDYFGKSVAIDGNYVIVGGDGDDDTSSTSGSAYIFDVTTGTQLHKLTASDAAADDYFGGSVAISGNYAIVGSYGDDDDGSNSGSAYIFNIQNGTQIKKITASDAASSDYFGHSVAISGNYAIVGSKGDDKGSAYIFGPSSAPPSLLKITNDSPNMVVNGNVGIGTTSPNYLGNNEPTPNSTNFPYLSKPGSGATAPIKLDVRGSIELSSEDPGNNNPDVGAYAPNIYFPANNAGQMSGLIWRNYHNFGKDIKGGILFEPHKGGYGYASGGLGFYTSYYNAGDSSYNSADEVTATCKMTIRGSGNIGIGTTSPITKLDIRRNGGARLRLENTSGGFADQNQAIEFCTHYATTGFLHQKGEALRIGVTGSVSTLRFYTDSNTGYPDQDGNSQTQSYFNETYTSSNDNPRMVIANNGNVGIGTTTPEYPLAVYGTPLNAQFSARWFDFLTPISTATGTDPFTDSGGNNRRVSNKDISIYANTGIWALGILASSSDRRIKKNIVDVSDNQALEMLNNIPCRYYEYKDHVLKGEGKTIGFIAQEVREVMPMAINIEKSIIPNEMRQLDTSWNDTTLTTDLQDASGVKYKFYVSNNDDFSDEVEKEIIGNADNSFTFDQSWNNVFCYGREVDDFHTLDKQKLFALNFSATQELDRKVTSLETENQELKTEVATLKAELAAIKAHLGI